MRASTWGGLAALWLAVLGASLWALQPPAPLPRDAPADRFSEGRARDLVRRLSDDIGVRVNGTPEHARAAELLAAELLRIPGVEVELQDTSSTQIFQSVKLPVFVYRTVNVVARLPGRSPRAILLDAHFDTLVDSVGAADDAAGVAAIVETVRVLAREAPLARTVILNLNGGEEAGLFGAAGFLSHRWARDVDAYLYLEALPGGKAGLFGAGPGEAWLAKTYARVAPAPLGNVVGQDLVQSGLLPHNGDFTPFHEAGLRGLDVAMTGDGWAYHTALDRLARLQPGGLQHMGDTALAVMRALASQSPAAAAHPDPEPVVYYDILGATMVTYRVGTARMLAFGALALAGLVLVVSWRRRVISVGGVLAALGWTALASFAGLAAAIGSGVLLGRVHPHGWFSAPVLVLPAFAAPALAAMLVIRSLWRRRALRRTTADRHASEAWAGALLFWWLWLALAAIAAPRLGAAYLAFYWVMGGAAGALLALLPRWARARPALTLLCLLPGTVLTVELGVVFLKYFVPIAGLLPSPVPLDFLIAALVGLVVVATGAAGLAVPHRPGGLGKVALGCTAVAIVGVAATALHFPYSAERPKRLVVAQQADDTKSAILMASGDALNLAPVLATQTGFVSARPGWPPYEAWLPPFSHERPAAAPALAAPRVDVIADSYDAASDRRHVDLRVTAPGAQFRLALPAERLQGWSLSPTLEAVLALNGQLLVHFEGLADDGHQLSLTIKGRAPLPIEVRAIDRRPADSPEIRAVREHLPPWTTPTLVSIRSTRLAL